jgi:diaminopimelate decarboxylase
MSAHRKADAAPRFVDPAQFTPHFSWRAPRASAPQPARLFCEDVAVADIAAAYGTPSYLYSGAAITDAYRQLHSGLRAVPHTLCFAVKANSNLAILERLASLGSGFDIVSGGELYRLGHLGVEGRRIVFSGVGKSREEIREALRYRRKRGTTPGILLFNIESEAELEVLVEESARALRRGIAPPAVAIRVNPDVAAGGHPHISTGRHHHKFGIDWPDARRLYLAHRESRHIRWRGISVHIGSQIVALRPFRAAFARLAGYVQELRAAGIALRYLDLGGGLGARYTDEPVPSRAHYAAMIARAVKPLGLNLLLEPGRSIVAAAGVLLTRVIYTKTNRGREFVVVDAAMNDLMRPALYGATHPITRVVRAANSGRARSKRADIVGPVCETGDCFLRDWPLGSAVHPGEVLAIWAAGAYGMAQTSNYNARCRPAEILVDGKKSKLIRRRESRKDLLRHELRR